MRGSLPICCKRFVRWTDALAICGLSNGLTRASGPMSSGRVPRLVLFEVDISMQSVVDKGEGSGEYSDAMFMSELTR